MDSKYNVWYADDDLMFANLFKERLDKEEFEVKLFPNGDGLCPEFHSSPVHLVLLDYDMPGATGLDIVRKIRSVDQNIPVVIFSVHANPQIATEAYNLGVEFINKDCEWDLFLAKIRYFIRRYADKDKSETIIRLSEKTTFDAYRNVLVSDNKEYLLNKVSANLLKLLYSNINEWAFAEYLTRGLWQLPMKEKVGDLRRQIFFLREKLSVDASIRIDNGYGSRYRLVIPMLPKPTDEDTISLD